MLLEWICQFPYVGDTEVPRAGHRLEGGGPRQLVKEEQLEKEAPSPGSSSPSSPPSFPARVQHQFPEKPSTGNHVPLLSAHHPSYNFLSGPLFDCLPHPENEASSRTETISNFAWHVFVFV